MKYFVLVLLLVVGAVAQENIAGGSYEEVTE